jgi:hypothetical protein
LFADLLFVFHDYLTIALPCLRRICSPI